MQYPDIARPKGDLIERIVPLATSMLANALDDIGLHDNVISEIKGVASGFRFVGPAVTVKESAGRYGTFSSDDFKVGEIIGAAKPGESELTEAYFCTGQITHWHGCTETNGFLCPSDGGR